MYDSILTYFNKVVFNLDLFFIGRPMVFGDVNRMHAEDQEHFAVVQFERLVRFCL